MTYNAKILAFAGSTRKESFNKKLLNSAVTGAEKEGASVTVIDLADYPMPIYNADLETASGIPEDARRFKRLLTAHDGFLIASPEYNGFITPLLKNVIDWASRRHDHEAPYHGFEGKSAALLSASPGALGGMRSLWHLRILLGNLRVLVIPQHKTLPRADKAFDAEGRLVDARVRDEVEAVAAALVRTLVKLNG